MYWFIFPGQNKGIFINPWFGSGQIIHIKRLVGHSDFSSSRICTPRVSFSLSSPSRSLPPVWLVQLLNPSHTEDQDAATAAPYTDATPIPTLPASQSTPPTDSSQALTADAAADGAVTEVGATEVGATEVGATEVGATADRVTAVGEVADADTAVGKLLPLSNYPDKRKTTKKFQNHKYFGPFKKINT